MKICTGCKKDLSLSSFYKNKRTEDGFCGRCKSCYSTGKAKYRKSVQGIKNTKKGNLTRRYNISIEEYNNKVEAQHNCCAICGIHRNFQKKDLAVDHCHKTGKVRSLLCNKCNTILGQADDDIALLEKIISYLKRYS